MLKRISTINLSVVSIVFSFIVLFALVGCGNVTGTTSGSGTTSGPGVTPTVNSSPTPSPASAVPFKVTSIDMAVNPTTIAGMACGTNLKVVYTATFHVPSNSPGGTVQFTYTVNNGRSSPPASLTFAAGQTSKVFTFSSTGTLSPDNVYPGLGGVLVSSPNALQSPMVKPTGTCTQAAQFKVLSIDMAVNPTTIAGLKCGTYITVTYTATFHVAPNSPGGTVQFMYTVNNGRGSTMASLVFAPGETTKTYTFTWSGNLPPDHTYPEPGGVMTSSPNQVTSQLVGPSGMCS